MGDIRATIAELETFTFFSLPRDEVLISRAFQPTVLARRPTKAGRTSAKSIARSTRKSSMRTANSNNDETRRKSVQFSVVPPVRPCRDFFAQLELQRNEKVVQMVRMFESIGPTLVKLESLILGTFTGSSPKMKQYYTFWEKELFHLLLKWTNNNMDAFGRALYKDEPIFQVDALLAPPDIVMRPTANEVFSIVVHSVKDFLERLRSFRRWLDGTCLLCEPLIQPPDDEQYMFTFFEDVLQVPNVGEMMNGLQAIVSRLISDVTTYLLRWRKYQNLWLYDKSKICERFVGRNASLARLDEKFLFYSQLVSELRLARPYQDLRGMRINLQPLIDAICEHAIDWSTTLGRILNERTYANLIAMKEHIQQLRLDLDRNIKGLSDFKTVMATIAIVQTTTLTVEMSIREMQETYSVLEEHDVAFEYTDMMMAYHLEKRWRKLYNSSMNRGLSLAPIKKKFADMTCVEIQTFALDVRWFEC